MTDDDDFQARLLAQAVGKGVQHRAQAGDDLRAVGGKGNVAGHAELELVVGRLLHPDAGACGHALHVAALVFHVLRPGVGAQRAYGRANGRTPAIANEAARRRAHAGADHDVALPFSDVGAASQHGGGAGGGQQAGGAGAWG